MEAQDQSKWYQSSLGIIALLVLFFPVGLILMWLYSGWSNKAKWVVTGVFAFLLIGAAISGPSSPKIPRANEAASVHSGPSITPTLILTPTPTPPQTLEDKIKTQLGMNDTVKVHDAVDINTNAAIVGKKQVRVDINLDKTPIAINAAKGKLREQAAGLVKYIFPLDENIYSLIIAINVPFTDTYGNKDTKPLEYIIITRDTFNKIRWDNFNYQNISKVADSYFEDKSL